MTSYDGRPMYARVADDLRARIVKGTLPVGAELPSTARLMEEFDVSVTVVRAAVRELRSEGLVLGQPGKAVFVQRTPEGHEQHTTEFTEVLQELRAIHAHMESLETRLERLERQTSDHNESW